MTDTPFGKATGGLTKATTHHARRHHHSQAARLTLFARSLAWAALASRINRREAASENGFRLHVGSEVEMSEHGFRSLIVEAAGLEKEGEEDKAAAGKEAAQASGPGLPAASGQPASGTAKADALIVIPHIGNANTKHGREVQLEFKDFVSVALPLPAMPTLRAVRQALVDEFPWAATIVDEVLGDLRSTRQVCFRPTVFVGPPGGGKTRFAKALATAAGPSWDLMPCGGMSDSTVGGTPRRWHTSPASSVHCCSNKTTNGPSGPPAT